jgi:hypothetical protein
MLKLCPECKSINEGKHSFLSGNIYLAIIEFIAVILIMIIGQAFGSKIIGITLGIFFLAAGIKNLVEYYKGGKICPKCNNKSMIPLDTPKAQELIKENNLTIPK